MDYTEEKALINYRHLKGAKIFAPFKGGKTPGYIGTITWMFDTASLYRLKNDFFGVIRVNGRVLDGYNRKELGRDKKLGGLNHTYLRITNGKLGERKQGKWKEERQKYFYHIAGRMKK